MSFKGKRVFITGAGRGLGAAFAVALADQGAHVIMSGRNVENLNSTAESIRLRSGQRPDTLHIDLADISQVTLSAKKLRDEGLPLDILINNGAQWLPGKLHDNDAYAINSTITGIVTGTLLLTRGLIPLLEKSGAGDILNIISISGIANTPLLGASVAYYAAKHGQAGLNDGLRQELKDRPVRVSAIYPSWIKDISPLDETAWNAPPEAGSLATNRDVVETAFFALSRPRHMTLASIVIDPDRGGLY
ncbi:MAG: SDR family NAD(P)-dependent oxidoreductase [Rhizobiales bacterium]|nr:SDR family NAD(P)-dependent oxidoreductase [Hyphomicrobiales bacterium]MBI3674424.1 SDR family NAD(P)-dependent oxidoreductase [Hyphomicrobiales bacterium]